MKIAVIGSGISGLSAAYYLSKKYKVDLFEKDDHFGGHSYTFDIHNHNRIIPVDLGFIVFNHLTYPNLIKFFNELNVPYEKSNMSFSVSVDDGKIEYGGSSLGSIFSNKANIFNLKFINMLREIISFYKTAPRLLNKDLQNETLGSFLNKSKLSKYFINYHIIPMVAAIWSMPFNNAKEMPLPLFIKFFSNHGLFKLKNRPQWYTVTNRSKAYVNKVTENISGEIFKNYKVKKVVRNDYNVRILIDEEYIDYDHVILATHADQSLRLIDNPTIEEKKILSKFTYVSNTAVLHTDKRLMPKKNQAWSSWNSITKNGKTCITYWLNKLQNLSTEKDYFLTLNPVVELKNSNIIKKLSFTHPYFDKENVALQKSLSLLQGTKKVWFCGSYFGYGFHEDGLKSSLDMLKQFKDQVK